jgi:uncharacterized circularly permuted ATP-grasp superfamily protein
VPKYWPAPSSIRGITFALKGVERPFPLDIVPRSITAAEWRSVQAGVAQRIRALEAFLADVYGEGHVLSDGVVPRRVVVTSRHFHRCDLELTRLR